MNAISRILSLFTFSFLAGCGGNSADINSGPPPLTGQIPGIESRQDHGTGPITFTFNFSEPIKTAPLYPLADSFIASDIVVTNGAPNPVFNMVSNIQATLVVTALDATAPVSVSVGAGAFQDLAGNVNIASASYTHRTSDTVPPTVVIGLQGSSQFTFDVANIDYSVASYGGETAQVVTAAAAAASGVTGSNGNSVQVIKSATAEEWAATIVTWPVVETGIPFKANAHTMSMRVYAPTGIKVRLVVENVDNDLNGDATVKAAAEATTTATGWQVLPFTFNNTVNPGDGARNSGTYKAIDLTKIYDRAQVAFTAGVRGADGGNGTFYFDDIMFPLAP